MDRSRWRFDLSESDVAERFGSVEARIRGGISVAAAQPCVPPEAE